MNTCAAPKVCEVQANLKPRCICKCDGPHCNFTESVCGSDGVTYASGRILSEVACHTENPELMVSYYHACKRELRTAKQNTLVNIFLTLEEISRFHRDFMR